MTRNRGHNCQHFVMNRQYDSIFSACKRMFIIWNIFCKNHFEFHNNNGGCMNGHCHSFDINPNLAYSGWLVSIGNGEETHWHYTVHEPFCSSKNYSWLLNYGRHWIVRIQSLYIITKQIFIAPISTSMKEKTHRQTRRVL